jgi:hypothetical protein
VHLSHEQAIELVAIPAEVNVPAQQLDQYFEDAFVLQVGLVPKYSRHYRKDPLTLPEPIRLLL